MVSNDNGPADYDAASLPLFHRVVISVALLSGLGSGALSVVGTADRYYGKDAVKDFALRDTEIQHLQQEIKYLRQWIGQIDATHPPPELIKDIDDHEKRIRALERTR